MTQAEILQEMLENTHTLYAPSFIEKVNKAFSTNIQPRTYKAGGGPKGLTLYDGGYSAVGIACFELAPCLCDALKVRYESKMGRGFQVQACVKALREAGYDK